MSRPTAAVVVVAVVAGLAGCSSAGTVATAPPVPLTPTRAALALRSLDLGASPAGAGYAATLARNARRLRLDRLTWRYAGPGPTPDSVHAEVTWRLPEDRRAVTTRVAVTLGEVAGRSRPRVTGVHAAGERWPVWLAGPVAVRRAPGVLVVAAGTGTAAGARPTAARYAALAVQALAVVRRVVPTRRPLVVEVPASAAGLADALAATPDGYAGVAATTTTADARTDAAAPVRVVVDPAVLGRLGHRAALVVLAHEATHAETGAATARMPLWLLEGFADHVALRDVGLPVRRLLAHAITAVRAHGTPTRLPRATDLRGPGAEAAYEEAWLATQVLVHRGGERRLVRLYDRVRAGVPVRMALLRIFGTSQRTLTRIWGQRLARWAR